MVKRRINTASKILAAAWTVVAFQAPLRMEVPRHLARSVTESSSPSQEASESPIAGVDMWGNPVTEADLAPAVAEEEATKPEKTYAVQDFVGSEWKIGVVWGESERVDVSWFRLKGDGVSEWGFNVGGRGRWKLDEGKYVTVSQDYLLGWNGKRLWTAKICDDPNYLEGIIRGWKPWEPASIMGRWEAIRLGVDRPNPPPWHDLETRLQAELDADEKEEGEQKEQNAEN